MATERELGTELDGEMRQGDTPNWAPLERLVDDALADRFMWMYDVELEDGTMVQVYKDHLTRRSMHLADDGRAFAYVAKGRYREVEPGALLMAVYIDPPENGRLTAVQDAALRLALAKLDAQCDGSG